MRRLLLLVLIAVVAVAGLYAWLGGILPRSRPLPGAHEATLAAGSSGEPGRPASTLAGSVGSAAADFQAAAVGPQAFADLAPERVTIGRNESFYVAFQRAGFDHQTIVELVAACRAHVNLSRVRHGDVFELTRDPDRGLLSLRAEVDAGHYLVADRTALGFSAQVHSYPVQRVVKGAQGTIRTSLFEALTETGADPALAVALGEILGWDIDFFRDLRRGDTFEVVYEEFVHEGRTVRDGRLLSARYVNDGRVVEAFYFPSPAGRAAYFDGSGRSLEKQFLRAPLRYDRVSSGYSRRRFHPILKYARPHEGIDYAAPAGTPVRATASGVVTVRERFRGNGNYIVLRHGAGYETWYLHLSRFARGLAVGERVQQGDVIGYVGSTGLSTAPHLCYRVKHNGRFLNPSRMEMPPSEPVAQERRVEFEQVRDRQRLLQAAIPDSAHVAILEAPAPAEASFATAALRAPDAADASDDPGAPAAPARAGARANPNGRGSTAR